MVKADDFMEGENGEETRRIEKQESRQVQLRFSTKLPAAAYRLPVSTTSFAVPSHLTRHGLSEIINTLLQLDKEQPFDFLIDGELVRTSLEKFLLSKGISPEKIVDVEYILVVVPPQEDEELLHDDWVSVVDGSHSSFIFSGSYDSVGRIWKEGLCSHFLEGHKGAITSAAFVRDSGDSNNDLIHIATASKDRTVRLWEFPSEGTENSTKVSSCMLLKGHALAVQSVCASSSGNLVCSGSWDASIKVWPCAWEMDPENDSGLMKKRKLEDESTQGEKISSEIQALSTLEGHTECVSSLAWYQDGNICSASWDHSVRIWNIESGANILTMGCGKSLNCLSVGGEACQLTAAAGADPVLRIWDPRMPGTTSPILQLSSHKSWISSCKWHPNSKYHLLSASYDGTLKLWDIRGKVPLLTLEAHKDKVLSTDWWKDDCIVSGGADSNMKIFSNVNIR